MRYIRTRIGTEQKVSSSPLSKAVDSIFRLLPSSNPGYEGKFHLVTEWAIEFDDGDSPWREVALDTQGSPIFAGPSDENYGFWLDTNMKYCDFEGVEIKSEEFELLWAKSGVQVVT